MEERKYILETIGMQPNEVWVGDVDLFHDADKGFWLMIVSESKEVARERAADLNESEGVQYKEIMWGEILKSPNNGRITVIFGGYNNDMKDYRLAIKKVEQILRVSKKFKGYRLHREEWNEYVATL